MKAKYSQRKANKLSVLFFLLLLLILILLLLLAECGRFTLVSCGGALEEGTMPQHRAGLRHIHMLDRLVLLSHCWLERFSLFG